MAAADKFGSTRLFLVNKDDKEFKAINVYVAKKGSPMGKVAFHTWNVSDPKEWKKRMKSLLEPVKATHSIIIWPDRPIPTLYECKLGGTKRKRSDGEDVGEQIFSERTMPTSMVFAWLVMHLTQGKRHPEHKIKGIKLLHRLIDSVLRMGRPTQGRAFARHQALWLSTCLRSSCNQWDLVRTSVGGNLRRRWSVSVFLESRFD